MNLEDVAQRAGVSTATVSRVLNNISVVKNSTRARVLKAVEELKYYPNIHARALAGGSTRTLGLIVSNLENPFFQNVFHALEQEARKDGFEVLVANTQYDPERLTTAVRLMLGRRVAGLALVVSEIGPNLIDELAERDVRTVIYSVGAPRPNIHTIKTNYRKGMQLVAEYLHGLGHRKMAFVGHHTTLGPLSDRQRTFEEVMERFAPGVQFTTIARDDGFAGGADAVQALFANGLRPSAVICVNDFMAVGVLSALRRLGLRVPGDVSVTGHDNINLSEHLNPSLTTVHVPRDDIGRSIFRSLVMDNNGPAEMVIEPELVVRESTGPAPG
ncbi:MAG: LacI family DNA-binding transcriptional regulator [Bryobacteraceae bacterium]